MELFASSVEKLLSGKAVTPDLITRAAADDLGARGIRQPGGLLPQTVERMTFEALQEIYDSAVAERERRKSLAAVTSSDDISAYLSGKYKPLRDFAVAHATGRRTSFASTVNAKADELLQLAQEV